MTKRSVRQHFFVAPALTKEKARLSSPAAKSAVNRLYCAGWGLVVAVHAVGIAGCSSDDSDPSAGGGAGGVSSSTGGAGGSAAGALSYRACEAAERFGGFEVSLSNGAVQGQVLDGVIPSYVPQELGAQSGCRLLQGKNLFCDPACGSSETCGEGGACEPTPLGQNVGDVVVSGARTASGANEIPLEPTTSNFYTTRATLAEPPFALGAEVKVSASGSAFVPAFTLRGEGIAALDVPDDAISVEAGTPLALRWNTPEVETSAHVEIKVQFNLHGSTTAAYIACDVADSGSFSVPAALIDELLGRELSGFPTVVLTRRTADSLAVGDGCLDFAVSSRVSRALEVPGVVSCNDDGDCEPGQVCARPQLVCE